VDPHRRGEARVPPPLPLDQVRPTDAVLYGIAGGDIPGVPNAGGGSLFRTSDCAQSWTRTPVYDDRTREAGGLTALVRGADGVLYAGRGLSYLEVSADDGASWNAGVAFIFSDAISASLTVPGIAYAVLKQSGLRGQQGLYRLLDGHESFAEGPLPTPYAAEVVAADPQDEMAVYAGGHLCQANVCDRGIVWRYSEPDGPAEDVVAEFDSPVTALAVNVDGARLWVATGDQHLRWSGDGGATWTVVQDVPYTADVHRLAPSVADPAAIFAATTDWQLWAYRAPAPEPDPDLPPAA
jgi:photosystem II stability/assembly factor-like uncharacterized protein